MIDIILAAHNGRQYLKEQLDSILEQDFTDFRLIIRDDASNDGTVELLNMYSALYPDKIQLLDGSEASGSAKNNFFILMKATTAPYVMFADQDDVWEKDKVQKAFDHIKKMEKKHGGDKNRVIPCLILLIFLIWISLGEIFGAIGDFIYKILPKSMKEKIDKKRAEKIEKKIRALLKKYDSELFKRQTYSEAYADNFARMYGYGAPLMRGLHKLDKKLEKDINTYIKREADRRKCIMNFTECLLRDVHKTNVHRARNIIREYRKEIDDPNTPAEVKKQLEADVKELEIFLDKYLNDFSEMQNNINKVINENITKLEKEEDKKEAKEKAKEEKKKEDKKDK
jgi:glycosyltransferase involved in cell wall biosynthesis